MDLARFDGRVRVRIDLAADRGVDEQPVEEVVGRPGALESSCLAGSAGPNAATVLNEADFRARPVAVRIAAIEGVNRVIGRPVRRDHVQHRLARSCEVERAGRGAADAEAHESAGDDDQGLVDRRPEVDEVPVLPRDVSRVLPELVGDVGIEPARRAAEIARQVVPPGRLGERRSGRQRIVDPEREREVLERPDLFGDMRLIGEMYAPEIAFLPIGDYYTMGPEAAARACQMLGIRQVVPMHFGTFPILTGTPERLRHLVEPLGVDVLVLRPGETAS